MTALAGLGLLVLVAMRPEIVPATPEDSPIQTADEPVLGRGGLPQVIEVPDGQNSYVVITEPAKANFAFNAVAPHWKEKQAGEDHRTLEIRVSADNRTWGDWAEVEADGPLRDNDPKPDTMFPETPLFVEGRYYQLRISLEQQAEMSDLVVTYIDSRESTGQKVSRVMNEAFAPQKALADNQQGPGIVTRAQWGSPDPYGELFRGTDLEWFPSYVPVTQMFVHHTVNANNSSNFPSVVRGIWQYQAHTRGWGDIGYNYLVDGNGTIYQGRFGGENVTGGHTLGYNRGSLGVALIGCFQSGDSTCRSFNGGDRGPSSPMLDSLYNLLGWKAKSYEIDPHGSHSFCGNSDVNFECRNLNKITGHRDAFQTSCPGDLTVNQLASIRDGTASRKANLFPYAAKQLSFDTITSTEGQTAVTLSFKNTGSATWSNSSPRLFLKTANPDDRSSIVQGNDWVTGQHAALLNQASVAPGGTGSFTFNITGANTQPGKLYYEGFRLVVEGVTDIKSDFIVPVQAPTFEWALQSVNYGAGSSLMHPGQTQTITVVAQNTGTATWNNSSNPMRLATWAPERESRFHHSSLISPARMATMQESNVAPGQTATFSFLAHAPAQAGEYGERIGLVAENRAWVTDNGSQIYFRVANQYQWQPVSLSHSAGTALMDVGDTQNITIVAKNMGTATWSNSGANPIRLGTWEPTRQSGAYHSSWLSQARLAEMQESSVPPGSNGTFVFTVLPKREGQFFERVNLVAENLTWFNDPGLQFYLNARAYYAWQPESLSYSPQNSTLPAGSTVTLTLKARNLGNTAWHKNTFFPLRLATVRPLNRGSVYEHSNWLSSIRPAALQEATVPSGSVGTFVFDVRVPSTPGEYRDHFSLVAENFTWLNDPGFSVYIKSF